MAPSQPTPRFTWYKQHVHPKRYITSGPPRDLVGLRDMGAIENPYQRREIMERRRVDDRKFAAGHEVDSAPERQYPDPQPPETMPNNQGIEYYINKGFEAARNEMHGHAYYYFTEAVNKAKTLREKARWGEAAQANLKAWRAEYCR